MNPQDFRSEDAGRLVKTTSGDWAFVPAPPPRRLAYDDKLIILLAEAEAALSELSGVGRVIPNPDLLVAPYLRREAVASSRIEGTQADLKDLLIDEVDPRRTPPTSDVGEIWNYMAAMKHGIELLDRLPISGRLVRELHSRLMEGVRGQDKTPGEYRRSQNWIGPPGTTLADATYVPPPHEPHMHECLRQWEAFVNERDSYPHLVQCALMHEYFEAIHPFLDGNGRVGRLLIALFLMERGRLSKPLLYLSSYIEQHRTPYYELLQRIRTHGDWLAWLRYFLTAVRETARNAILQCERILRLREQLRAELSGELREQALMDKLFKNPYVNVELAAMMLKVTPPTASRTIRRLEAIKLLTEYTGRARDRFWVARPILDAVQNSPVTTASASTLGA